MSRLVKFLLVAAALLVAFVVGAVVQHRSAAAEQAARGPRVLYWHDPMHPEYRSDKPGIAPDCGMQLEPVYADGTPGEVDRLKSMPFGSVRITAEKQQLVGVRIDEAERSSGVESLRTVGRVAPDERRVFRINTSAAGWVRETYAHTVGSRVAKGDPLLSFTTTDLTPQQNYLTTMANARRFTEVNTGEHGLATIRAQVASSRATLESFGMSDAQIAELERTSKVAQKIVLRSPADAFVLARNVTAGLRFEANQELMVVADLQRVWVVADLFEYEEGRVVRGGPAKITLPHQGRTFEATVSEDLPVFDEASRTFKVRLELANPEFVLRPGMYVDVELPMKVDPAVVVAVDAVLDTGTKKIVFVDRGEGYFEPRRVETGWRYGDRVEVRSGLASGERVVTSGTFLVDAESRLKAAAAGMRGEPAKDVVCGMDVDERRAKAAGRSSEHGGVTYVFCSPMCKKQFDANPAKYLGRDGGPSPMPVRELPAPVRPPELPEPNTKVVPASAVMPAAASAPEAHRHD